MLARNYVFVGLVLVASRALGAPFSLLNNECDKKLSRFHNGKLFIYEYEGETTSGVIGTSEARTGLKITARCEIESTTHCDHKLRISNVELWEAQSPTGDLQYTLSKGSAALGRDLEKYILQFQTSKGTVTNVFHEDKETQHVLNIKRGILSALQLQHSDKPSEELDVTGRCTAHYKVLEAGSENVPNKVVKSKNLTKCAERSVANLGMNMPSFDDTTFNPLNSNSECIYNLKANGAVEEVVCTEKHIFIPFTGVETESGAITKTSQRLTLVKYGKRSSIPDIRTGLQATTLKFVHPKKTSTSRQFSEIDLIMNEMVSISKEDTKPQHARLFSRLVYNLRKMDKKSLVAIWSKYFDCEKEKTCNPQDKDKYSKYILDSFVHCTTEPCSEVMIDLIKSKEIVGETANMFLMGLALQPSPTPNMISDVLYLCEKNPSRSSMLTLGTIVNKYCLSNPGTCNNLSILHPISKSQKFLVNIIGSKCESKSLSETENIILALKAVGNAGRPITIIGSLVECAKNPEVPMNVSLAAMEALRQTPCDGYPTKSIFDIYADLTKDVELRIAGYLALMRCPTQDIVEKIIDVHQNEASNQVGSFVWSHMTNMLESTAPLHHRRLSNLISAALKDKTLREFNLDLRKFSRAWEGSMFNDYTNTGASIEAHTIFHPSSYFPRSSHVNMQAELMGVKMSILEAAGRFEGFETLLEQFFGPEGIFPDERITEMFDLKDEEGNSPNQNRMKRDIQDDFNLVERNLEDLHKKVNMKRPLPSGSVSMKLMGQEMRLATYDDINWLMSEADNINVIEKLIQLAKGGKYTYRKSFVFLEADITVPTGLGLPLLLHVNGTTVGSVELDGKCDIRNLFWGNPSMDIRGSVKPSSVVEVAGEMGIDAIYATAGLLVNMSMFTSTSLKGNVTYRHGEVLKISLAAPEEPMQIVNMSSGLFTIVNGNEEMIKGPDARLEPDFCVNATTVLGLGLCTRLSVPAPSQTKPFYPLSGPTSFELKMIRTDPKLTTFNLDVMNVPSEDEMTYEMIFHSFTPGAMYERNLESNATLLFDGPDTKLFFTMGALGYTFGTMEGGYNNITHGTYAQFSTKDIVLGNPIKAKIEFFNKTSEEDTERDVGVAWSFTYNKYTMDQVTEFYRHEDTYGFLSNLTYWPGKHIIGEAEISRKHFKLLGSDSITKTFVVLDGHLGDKVNSLGFNITNNPLNSGISVRGEHIKTNNTLRMIMHALPCKQTVTANGWYASTGNEKGIHMQFRDESKNREMTWFGGIVNSPGIKGIITNASLDNQKAKAVLNFFSDNMENGLMFSVNAMDNNFGVTAGLHSDDILKKVRLSGVYNKHTAQMIGSFSNDEFVKSLCMTGELNNKKVAEMCSTVLNNPHEKAVILNGTVMDKTANVSASYLTTDNEYATRLQVNYQEMTYLEAWSSYEHSIGLNAIRMNATVMDRTLDSAWEIQTSDNAYEAGFKMNYQKEKIFGISSRYVIFPGRKTIGLAANFKEKTADVQLVYSNTLTDKSAGVQLTIMGKKSEVKGTYITMEGKKGVNFHLVHADKTMATAGAMYSVKKTSQAVKLTMMVSGYMAILKTEFRNNEMKELIMTTTVKQDMHTLYKDHRSIGVKNTPRDKAFVTSMGWEYNQMKYNYGWSVEYKDNSYDTSVATVQSSALLFTLLYGNGKKMSWDYTYTNKQDELSFRIISIYPNKTLTQSVVYYKQRQLLYITLEPKVNTQLMFEASFDSTNGIDFNSRSVGFGTSMTNFFKYNRQDGTYNGQLEFWPKQPISINGKVHRNDGFYFDLTLKAFDNKWYEEIDFKKTAQTLDVTMEILPGKPITLNLDLEDVWNFRSNMKTSAIGMVKDAQKYISEMKPFMREGTTSYNILGRHLEIFTDWDAATKEASIKISYAGHVIATKKLMDFENYIIGDTYILDGNKIMWRTSYDPENKLVEFKFHPNAKTSYEMIAEVVEENIVEMEFLKIVETQVTNTYNYKLDIKNIKAIGLLPTDFDIETLKKVFKDSEEMLEQMYEKTQTMVSEVYESMVKFYNSGFQAGLEYYKKMLNDVSDWYNKSELKDYLSREATNLKRLYELLWNDALKQVEKIRQMDYVEWKKYVQGFFEEMGTVLDVIVDYNVYIYQEIKTNAMKVISEWDVMVGKHQIKIKECAETLMKNLNELMQKVKKDVLALEFQGKTVGEMMDEIISVAGKMVEERMSEMKKMWENAMKDLEMDQLYTKLREMDIQGKNVGDMIDSVEEMLKEMYSKWSEKYEDMYEEVKKLYLKYGEEYGDISKLKEHLMKMDVFGTTVQEFVDKMISFEASIVKMYSQLPEMYKSIVDKASEMYEKLEETVEPLLVKMKVIIKSAMKHSYDILEEFGLSDLQNMDIKAKFNAWVEKFDLTYLKKLNEIMESSLEVIRPLIIEIQQQMMGIMVRGEPLSVHMETLQGVANDVVQKVMAYYKMEVRVLVDLITKEMEKLYKETVALVEKIPDLMEYDQMVKKAEEMYKKAGEKLVEIREELVKVFTQIKNIDMMKKITEAFDKLPKDKVMNMYNEMMQKMNEIKEKILSFVEDIKNLQKNCEVCDKTVELLYRLNTLARSENVMVELESIFNEAKTTMKSLFETVKEKVTSCYEDNYPKIKELYSKYYGKVVETYTKVEKHIGLFYQENKDQLEQMFEAYKTTVHESYETAFTFVMAKYTTVKARIEELYKEYEPKVNKMIKTCILKADEMYKKSGEMFKEALDKGVELVEESKKKFDEMIEMYGDYTWKDLAVKLYDFVYVYNYEMGYKAYETAKLWVQEYSVQVETFRKDVMSKKDKYITVVKEIIKKLNDIYTTEIYPRVMTKYSNTVAYLLKKYTTGKEIVSKVGEAVGVKVMYFNLRIWRWYTDNHNKPLREAIPALYNHLRDGVIDQFYNPSVQMFKEVKASIMEWVKEMEKTYESMKPEFKSFFNKLVMIQQDVVAELTEMAKPCVELCKEITTEYYNTIKKNFDEYFWVVQRIYQVKKEWVIEVIEETRENMEQFAKKTEAELKEMWEKMVENSKKLYENAVVRIEQYRAALESTFTEYKAKIMADPEIKKFIEREDVQKAWSKMKELNSAAMQRSPAMAKEFVLDLIPAEWMQKYEEVMETILNYMPRLNEYMELYYKDVEALKKLIQQDAEWYLKEMTAAIEGMYAKAVEYAKNNYAELKQKMLKMKTVMNELKGEIMENPQKYFDENVLPKMKEIWEVIVQYFNNPENLVIYMKKNYPMFVSKFEAYKQTVTELTETYVTKLQKEVIPDITEKINQISIYLKETVPEKYEEFKQKMQEYQQQLEKLREEIMQDPKKYLEQMNEKVIAETKAMMEKIQAAMPEEYNQYRDQIQQYMDKIVEYKEDISQMDVKDMKEKITELVNFLEEKFPKQKEMFEEYQEKVVEMIEKFKQMQKDAMAYVNNVVVPEISKRIDELVKDLETNFPTEIEKITEYRKQMMAIVEEYKDMVKNELVPQIQAKFNEMVKYLKEKMPALYNEMKEKLEEIKTKMEDLRVEIMANPELYWKDVVVPKADEILKDLVAQMKASVPDKFEEYKTQITEYREMISKMTIDDVWKNVNLDAVKELQGKFEEFVAYLKKEFPEVFARMEDCLEKCLKIVTEIKNNMEVVIENPQKYLDETVIPMMKAEIQKIIAYLENKFPKEMNKIQKYRTEMMKELETLQGKTLPEIREKIMKMMNTVTEKTEKLFNEFLEYVNKIISEPMKFYNDVALPELNKAMKMVEDNIDLEGLKVMAIGYREMVEYTRIYKQLVTYLEDNFPKQMKQIQMYAAKIEEIVKDPSKFYTETIAPEMQKAVEYLKKEYPSEMKKIQELQEKLMEIIAVYSKKLNEEIIPDVKEKLNKMELYVKNNIPQKFEEYKKIFVEQYKVMFEQYKVMFEEYKGKFEEYKVKFEEYKKIFVEQYKVKFEEYKKIFEEYKLKFDTLRREIMADPQKFWDDKIMHEVKEKYEELVQYLKTNMPLKFEEYKQQITEFREEFENHLIVKDPHQFITSEILPKLQAKVEELVAYIKKNYPVMVQKVEEYKSKILLLRSQVVVMMSNPTAYMYDTVIPQLEQQFGKFMEHLEKTYPEELAKVKEFVESMNKLSKKYVAKIRTEMYPQAKETIVKYITMMKAKTDMMIKYLEENVPEKYEEMKQKAEEFKQQLESLRKEVMADPRKYWEDVVVKKVEEQTENLVNFMKTVVPERMEALKSKMEQYRKEIGETMLFKDPEAYMKQMVEKMKAKLEEMVNYLKEKFPEQVKQIEELEEQLEELNEQYKLFASDPKKYVNDEVIPKIKLVLADSLTYLNENYPAQYAKVMDVLLTWNSKIDQFKNEIIPQLKQKLDEIIEFFRTNVPEKYEEVKAKLEELKKKVEELRKEVTVDPKEFFETVFRPKVTKQMADISKYLESNTPRRFGQYKRRLINYREEIESMSFLAQSLDYIKSTSIPEMKAKMEQMIKFLEEKFPENLSMIEAYKTKMTELIESYSKVVNYEMLKEQYNTLLPHILSFIEKIKIVAKEYIQEAETKYNTIAGMTPEEIVNWVKKVKDEAVLMVNDYKTNLEEQYQKTKHDIEEFRKVAMGLCKTKCEEVMKKSEEIYEMVVKTMKDMAEQVIDYSPAEGYSLRDAADSDRVQFLWTQVIDYTDQARTKIEKTMTEVADLWKRCPLSEYNLETIASYWKRCPLSKYNLETIASYWKRCPLSKYNLETIASYWKRCPLSSYEQKIIGALNRASKMTVKESITQMKEIYGQAVVKFVEVKEMGEERTAEVMKIMEKLRSEAMDLYTKIISIKKDDLEGYADELISVIQRTSYYKTAEENIKEYYSYIIVKSGEMEQMVVEFITEQMAEMKEKFLHVKTTLEYIDSSMGMGLRESSDTIKITRQLEDYISNIKKSVEARTGKYMKRMKRLSKKGLVELRKVTICLQDGWNIEQSNDEYILTIKQVCPYVTDDIQVPVQEIPERVTTYTVQWLEKSNCTMRTQIVTIIRVTRYVIATTKDIATSEDFPQALDKSHKVTLEAYKKLLQKYDEMLARISVMYKKLSEMDEQVYQFYRLKVEQAEGLVQSLDWNTWPFRKIQWSPPFNSTAMIFGRPHVYSFDGKYFEFPGYRRPECTYVLARDFQDGNFTLLSQENAMIILSEDGHIKIGKDGRVETVIKILPDGKIITDGHAKELPVEMANTTVSREGSVIKVVNTRGLEVVCDIEHFLCTINVAGWYHNKLAGILGTNNNEQYDEFTLPTGKITDNVAAFVNAWEITKAPACRIREDTNLFPICNNKASPRCAELLDSKTSPLAKYYKYLNPKPFLKACNFDSADCSSATPTEVGHCDSVAAYISLLKVKGYNADYLKECGRCNEHKVGQSWVQESSKAVDFVVLLPEVPSMKTYTEDLPKFLTSLSKEFSSLYKTRFAVVAFGGESKGHTRAHHVTVGGKLFGDARELTSAVQNMRFLKPLNDTSDIGNVLNHVIDLPFRAGASKVVLLLTNKDNVNLPHGMSLENVAELLQENDLTFNVIGNYKFKGAVVGQDASGKQYSRKQTKGVISSHPLPNGEHIELVKATNGSVFSLKAYFSGKKDVTASLERSMANALKTQIYRDQEKVKTCMCYVGEVGQGVAKCRNARPSKPFPLITLYNSIK